MTGINSAASASPVFSLQEPQEQSPWSKICCEHGKATMSQKLQGFLEMSCDTLPLAILSTGLLIHLSTQILGGV